MKDIKTLVIPALIVANGVAYLGQVIEDKSKVTIKDALPLGTPGSITKDHLNAYMVAAYSGKLTTTNIGANSPWSTTDLDADLTISWQIAQLRMEQAILTAPINAVVQTFQNLKS